MEIIEDRMVWGIIRRTLSCVDPRLVDHGERVAYIALELLRSAGAVSYTHLDVYKRQVFKSLYKVISRLIGQLSCDLLGRHILIQDIGPRFPHPAIN